MATAAPSGMLCRAMARVSVLLLLALSQKTATPSGKLWTVIARKVTRPSRPIDGPALVRLSMASVSLVLVSGLMRATVRCCLQGAFVASSVYSPNSIFSRFSTSGLSTVALRSDLQPSLQFSSGQNRSRTSAIKMPPKKARPTNSRPRASLFFSEYPSPVSTSLLMLPWPPSRASVKEMYNITPAAKAKATAVTFLWACSPHFKNTRKNTPSVVAIPA
mmetsp:Transcript_33737/g.101869  ORF Transcript_33737/g.101869 Transcript_33737/m.101869 type:complete len:218 (+) Transcript_33737:359-1012(+)